MDFFEEIYKEKEDLPKVESVSNEVGKFSFNFYQIFSFIIFCIIGFLGILLGNIFSTCQTSSYFYSNVCVVREFNFSLMFATWFLGLILSVFFFSIGHIVYYLRQIDKKLSKIRD